MPHKPGGRIALATDRVISETTPAVREPAFGRERAL